jgi:hypothetical protein
VLGHILAFQKLTPEEKGAFEVKAPFFLFLRKFAGRIEREFTRDSKKKLIINPYRKGGVYRDPP